MAITSLAFLLFAAVACSAYPQPDRIVGGQATTIENYPFLVQVDFLTETDWTQSCAGSILTTTVVLSAAHCYTGWVFSPSFRRVRAGATTRNTGGEIFQLSSVLNHPNTTKYNYDNDISILKLASPLTYSNSIQSIPILAQDVDVPDNLPVIYAGWGNTEVLGSPSSELQDVTVFTINHQECAQRYSAGSVTNNMICAGILDVGGKDGCQGDSGGPLYYDGILIGIISWGVSCAHDYFPGVNTRVSSYTDWIVSNAN